VAAGAHHDDARGGQPQCAAEVRGVAALGRAREVVDRTSTSTGVGIEVYAPAGTPSFGEYGPEFEQEEARS
jgi:hypothetical protein